MKRWIAFLLPRSFTAWLEQRNLPPEPRWFNGFGVYRESPWHLAGLYNERHSAERKLKKLEQKYKLTGYQIAWGKVQEGLDNFVVIDKNRDSKRPE